MKRREYVADVTAATMLPLVAFVVIPLTLYAPNQRDFDYQLQLLLPYAAAAVALVVLIAGVFLGLSARGRGRVAAVLFALGIYTALSDILCPVRLGQMRHGILLEPIAEPFTHDVLDVALLLGALALGAWLPVAFVRRFAPVLVVVLFLSEWPVFIKVVHERNAQQQREAQLAPPPETIDSRGNVYQITLDGFSAVDFPERLANAGVAGAFDGFVWFSENRANYLETYVSLPSYMQGSLYEGGSLKAWLERARTTGLLGEARQAGFRVSMYVPGRSYGHASASHLTGLHDFRGSDFADVCRFADLVLLHLAPHWLHQEVYPPRIGGVVSQLMANRIPVSAPAAGVLRSVSMLRQAIADEIGRPGTGQFVHIHLMIPHMPYVLDAECHYTSEASYSTQAEAGLVLVAEFIGELQRLERYDKALIIVHSDHGNGGVGPSELAAFGLAPDVQQRMRELESWPGFNAAEAFNLSRALMLVKAPGARGPWREDTRLTQNLDLPATVYAALGIAAEPDAGHSMLDPAFPMEREAIIYPGFSAPNEFGVNVRYGVRMSKGRAVRLVYRPNRGFDTSGHVDVTW